MTPSEEIRLNIQQIAHHHPFLGAIGMGLRILESTAFANIGTDINVLYINPEITKVPPFDNPAVRRFIIAHNILHNAFNHPFRLPTALKNTDMEAWITAQDIVVNNLLLAIQAARIANAKTADARAKEIKFPLFRAPKKSDGTLDLTYEPSFSGWSAERIYVEIIKGKETNTSVPFKSTGSSSAPSKSPDELKYEHKKLKDSTSWDTAMGTHTYFQPDDEKSIETQIRQHTSTINSINKIKACGSGTGDALRGLNEEIADEPTLQQALEEILVANEPGDTSWAKLQRRWLPYDLYFPSEDKNKGAELVIGIDVSGSIGQKELHEFWSIIKGALTSGLKLTIDIVSCDAVITSHHKVSWNEPESYEKIKELPGGGGTDFRPIFNWQAEHAPEAQAIIVFTDLCGTFPKNCDLPTFWLVDCALKGRMEVPFGQVVYYNPLSIYLPQ